MSALGLLMLASLLLVALALSLRLSALPAVALLFLLLGAFRADCVGERVDDLPAHHDARGGVEVRGTVVEPPSGIGATLSFRLSVDSVRAGQDSVWQSASGDALITANSTVDIVRARKPPLIRYGDRLEISGRLTAPEPIDDFDFPAYLERQGMRSVMSFPDIVLLEEGVGIFWRRWLSSLRVALAGSIARATPEPQAAFGQSILLGVRDGLPESLREDFRRTGASHLLAISGLHIGILLSTVISVSVAAFGRRHRLYLLAPLVAVWLYALLSGASPSAVRAAVMGTLYIAAIFVGRPRSLTPALALAAGLMAAHDPSILRSISFQLSFAAMLGIAAYYEGLADTVTERIGHGLQDDRISIRAARALANAIGITLAATIATAPLVGFYFQNVSLVGLPTTLLTMPAVPLALMSHAAAAVVGLVSQTAAIPLGWLAWGLSAYITGAVSLIARVSSASVEVGGIGSGLMWAYYTLLAALATAAPGYGFLRRRWQFRPILSRLLAVLSTLFTTLSNRGVPWQIVVMAVVCAALMWAVALGSRSSGRLEVAFVDVGQGDMAVITTPRGYRIVVDGGPDAQRAASALGEILPFWERSIDLAVLTHPHRDHIAGLTEVLRRYEVGGVLERRQTFVSADYEAWKGLIDSASVPTLSASAGATLRFDDGVSIEVLSPPESLLVGTDSDIDNGSVVLRIVYGRVKFLLTGDMFHEGESRLIDSGVAVDSDVIKVGHHGSRTSSSEEFIRSVAPVAAVISAGKDNHFGHPDDEIVERLESVIPQSRVFVTSEVGSVIFYTDGVTLWVDE